MRPIPYSHLSRSCFLAENAVRGAPRYVTRRLTFLVSVNPPRADVRTKKKREVHHTRADVRTKKTREVRAADNVKIMRDELEKGKKGMKRLRLPMAIPETVKEAPMATTLSSVPHESVPDIAPRFVACSPARSSAHLPSQQIDV